MIDNGMLFALGFFGFFVGPLVLLAWARARWARGDGPALRGSGPYRTAAAHAPADTVDVEKLRYQHALEAIVQYDGGGACGRIAKQALKS